MGMVRVDLLTPVLEIPKQKWTGTIESTFRASVEEVAYMNRIRCSISIQKSQNNKFDTDDPKSSRASHDNLLSVGNKRKITRDSEDLRAWQRRWKQIHGDRGQLSCAPGTAPDNGDQQPAPRALAPT